MRVNGRVSIRFAAVCAVAAALLATSVSLAPIAGAGQVGPRTDGFFMLGADGGIFVQNMPMAGAAAGDPSHCPNDTCTSMAVTPSGQGYWILDRGTGAVYAFGTAGFYGDPKTSQANIDPELVIKPLTIIPTPSGKGYYVYGTISGLGKLMLFGDAITTPFFGDTFSRYPWGTGHPHFNGHPVSVALTNDGKGWWEVWSDGGVFAFGDAKFYGSTGGIHLTREIVGITPTASGKGYWLVASDGGVFAFGDAVFEGSTGGLLLNAPVVGMVRNPAGPGYWLGAADGGVFGFGGAPWIGSVAQYGLQLHSPIAAIAAKRTTVG